MRRQFQFADVRSEMFRTDSIVYKSLVDLMATDMFQPTDRRIRERIASYQSADTYLYACIENGSHLGLVGYRLCGNIATVMDIAVRDDMRGQGIGTFLIDRLIQTTCVAQVLAETDEDAVGFYKAYGFTVIDTKTVCDTARYLCRYIPLELKTMSRETWPRVRLATFCCTDKQYGDFSCVAGLLTVHEVSAPLKKTVCGKDLVLADKGYRWLQIAPADELWWLTVMIDPNNSIVQYYYDITDRNILDGKHSRFYDLYLDVALLPDGNATILDTDELNAAFKDGIITNTQYEAATSTAKRLLQEVPAAIDDLEQFVMTVYRELAKEFGE